MAKSVVLITSATSRNGSNVAKLLLAQGTHTVRLAARDPSKLADLVANGAEAIALAPLSFESAMEAIRGVDIAYLVIPTLVNETEIVMFHNLLQAAKATGVKHIVYLSGVDAVNPAEAGFKPAHNHYEHEQLLLRSGIPFTSLRPAWFHENQVNYHSESIRRTGEFRTSAGDGLWTSVAVGDIAAAAVAVVNNPEAHAGKVYTLTTEAVTDEMVAEKVSEATGQKVAHVNVTPEEHADLIMAATKRPKEYADGLVKLDWEKRSNLFSVVHPDLEKLLGRKGVSLVDFLREHADAFKMQTAA